MTAAQTSLFIEVEAHQRQKYRQSICGDSFLSCRKPGEGRVLAVVSDGLGSGVKANILSTMTATMALKFAESNLSIPRSADIIMDALPICRERQIGYATFTIVDVAMHDRTRLVEMDNPSALLIRDGKAIDLPKREVASERWANRTMSLSEFTHRPQDRLIVFSDGISQAGLGTPEWKLGWRVEGCRKFVEQRIADDHTISARQLARDVVREALNKEPNHQAADDMTCAVLYFRRPRRLLVVTGPAFDAAHDPSVAHHVAEFDGRRAICGGTTANIIARELGREINTVLRPGGGDLPPVSTMDGADLVTEGILTLTRTAQYLERGIPVGATDAAAQLAELLRETDRIDLLVGTRINEAHQDPTLPVDLEIRRNIVKRIAHILEQKYLKDVGIEYT